MKARPILFNTEMVRAILAGRKTQTRRQVNSWPDESLRKAKGIPSRAQESVCPFGQPGDLLYVRETFAIRDDNTINDGGTIYLASEPCGSDRWKPSIHMPRWASRLTLEITDVRVERLQCIGADGEEAEGIDFLIEDPATVAGQAFNEAEHYSIAGVQMVSAPERFGVIAHFRALGMDWDANPWVWVVEFKVHHCNVDALLREREAA